MKARIIDRDAVRKEAIGTRWAGFFCIGYDVFHVLLSSVLAIMLGAAVWASAAWAFAGAILFFYFVANCSRTVHALDGREPLAAVLRRTRKLAWLISARFLVSAICFGAALVFSSTRPELFAPLLFSGLVGTFDGFIGLISAASLVSHLRRLATTEAPQLFGQR